MADLALTPPPVDLTAARHKDPAANIGNIHSRAEAERVAGEFEHMFLAQMLQPMFAGISTSAPFGGGQGEEMFKPMLIDEYAKAMSSRGGIGVKQAVLKEILKLQGLE
jgi:Rod binding domain-containing protein